MIAGTARWIRNLESKMHVIASFYSNIKHVSMLDEMLYIQPLVYIYIKDFHI